MVLNYRSYPKMGIRFLDHPVYGQYSRTLLFCKFRDASIKNSL